MIDLTAKEREAYRSGIWLAGGPRCKLCGCSESNHEPDISDDFKLVRVGCLVCSCQEFK